MLHRLERPAIRFAVVFSADAVIAITSLLLAMQLRFDGNVSPPYPDLIPAYAGVLVISRIGANFFFKLHRWSFRLSGLQDGARVVMAAVTGTGAFVLLLYMLRILSAPRSVVVMEMLISAAAMTVEHLHDHDGSRSAQN